MKTADKQAVITPNTKIKDLKLKLDFNQQMNPYIASSHTIHETLLYHKTKKMVIQDPQTCNFDQQKRLSADYFSHYSSRLCHEKD